MTNKKIGHGAVKEKSIDSKVSRKKKIGTDQKRLAVFEGDSNYGTNLCVGDERLCKCGPTHINCMSAKDWLKSQIGV